MQYCDYWCHSRMIVLGIEIQKCLGLFVYKWPFSDVLFGLGLGLGR